MRDMKDILDNYPFIGNAQGKQIKLLLEVLLDIREQNATLIELMKEQREVNKLAHPFASVLAKKGTSIPQSP